MPLTGSAEEKRTYYRSYYQANKELILTRKRRWAQEGSVDKKYRDALKLRVYDALGNKCVHCGFEDVRALQIDHINGGGAKDRKGKSVSMFYRQVLRVNCEGYQLLCANCNWIKRHENGEWK